MTEIVAAKAHGKPSQPPAAPASEALLSGVLETMGDGVLILDESGIVVRANKATAALLGKTPDEILGHSFMDLTNEEVRAQAAQSFTEIKSKGGSSERDWPMRAPNGDRMVIHARVNTLMLDGATRYCCILRDVTAQRALEGRERIFSRVLDSAPVVFWSVDKEGNFTNLEGRATDDIGKKRRDLVGKSSLDEFEGTEGHASVIRAMGGEEVASTMKLGGRVFDAWYMPVQDAFGEPDGMIGLGWDMTRVRQMEGAIHNQRSSQELLERLLSSAPFIGASISTDGTILDASGKGLESLGMKASDMIGANAFELFNNPEVAEALTKALNGEENRLTVMPVPDVFLDAWQVPVRDATTQEVTGVSFLGLDVTERMRAELELRDKLELIERQSATIRALATPIIKVWDELLCLPVIGTVDSARTAEMMDALLQAIVRDQARFAVVDLTGVEVVDTSTADHVIQLFKAANVLGVEGILCGIRPAVAQTVVALGVDLTSVRTMRTLQDALKYCIRTRAAAIDKAAARKKGPKKAKSEGATGGAFRSKA